MSAQLAQAAQAVIDRWDSPQWEWTKQGPTADLIADLRNALAAFEAAPQQEPVAYTIAGEVKNWSRDFSKYKTQHYVRPVYAAPQQAQAPGWVSVEDRLPAFGRVVPVTMYAGPVNNPSHPGYPGRPWIEHSRLIAEGGRMFMCEACQTGRVTHWLDVEAAPQQGSKS